MAPMGQPCRGTLDLRIDRRHEARTEVLRIDRRHEARTEVVILFADA
jgi:hypothetical protein